MEAGRTGISFKVLKEKNSQSRALNPVEIYFKDGKRFQTKLREFITSRPSQQEILKEYFLGRAKTVTDERSKIQEGMNRLEGRYVGK